MLCSSNHSVYGMFYWRIIKKVSSIYLKAKGPYIETDEENKYTTVDFIYAETVCIESNLFTKLDRKYAYDFIIHENNTKE